MNNGLELLFILLMSSLGAIFIIGIVLAFKTICLRLCLRKHRSVIIEDIKKTNSKELDRFIINPIINEKGSYFNLVKLNKNYINKNFIKYNPESYTVFVNQGNKYENIKNLH